MWNLNTKQNKLIDTEDRLLVAKVGMVGVGEEMEKNPKQPASLSHELTEGFATSNSV